MWIYHDGKSIGSPSFNGASNPRQTVNSNSQKDIEVAHDSYGNKVVRVEYKDPVTGERKKANIPYDSQRGLPVLDNWGQSLRYPHKFDINNK